MIFNNSFHQFGEKIRNLSKRGLFFSIGLILILIEALPIWHSAGIAVGLFSIFLFFCSVYFLNALTYIEIVLLGVLADSISASPIGFSSLRYLILYALMQTQANYFQQSGVAFGWFGFLLFSIMSVILYALLNFFVDNLLFFPTSLILTNCLAVLVYPFGFMCLHKIAHKIG